MDDKPRQQYYSFAHQALPELFFYDPAKLFHALESGGVEFLRYLWRKMGEYAMVEDDGSDLLLEVEFSQHEETAIALVVLPPPEKVTEVFFIALVYRVPVGEVSLHAEYLTLEQAMDLQGRPFTVLGG